MIFVLDPSYSFVPSTVIQYLVCNNGIVFMKPKMGPISENVSKVHCTVSKNIDLIVRRLENLKIRSVAPQRWPRFFGIVGKVMKNATLLDMLTGCQSVRNHGNQANKPRP